MTTKAKTSVRAPKSTKTADGTERARKAALKEIQDGWKASDAANGQAPAAVATQPAADEQAQAPAPDDAAQAPAPDEVVPIAKVLKPKKAKGAKAEKPAKEPKPAKAPKVKPPKKVSALDAAAQVLAASSTPMRAIDLIAEMGKRGLWTSPGGKTPEATLYAAIIREITAKGEASRFKKSDRGLFVAA